MITETYKAWLVVVRRPDGKVKTTASWPNPVAAYVDRRDASAFAAQLRNDLGLRAKTVRGTMTVQFEGGSR